MTGVPHQPCDRLAIASGPQPADRGPGDGAWVLAATIIGSSMAFIDGTVVGVALPLIQVDLHATAAGAQWVVEAYTLLLAALLLPGGSLGDRYGRRRVFALGIVLFTLASVACGLAPGINVLIAARAAQGIGGALMVPASLAIIGASFSPERRGRAIGTWSSFTSAATVLGPVAGGWLAEQLSWRAVFFVNVPLAVATLAMLYRHVPETRSENTGGRLDWPGALLAACGLGSITYGFIQSSSSGLASPVTLVPLAAGILLMAAFVIVEATSAAPMMPLQMFRSSTFAGTNLLTLLLYGALNAALFFLPFNLIQVQGYSATEAGMALLPFMLLLAILSRWSGTLADRFGARLPLVVGPLVVAAGMALLALPGTGGSYWTTFFPGIVVVGLGMAIAVAPLTTAVMGSVNTQDLGVASGINNSVSRVGGLLAVAVLGIAMAGTFGQVFDRQLHDLPIPPNAAAELSAQRTQLGAIQVPAELGPSLQAQVRQTVAEAFVAGFRVVMLICSGLALASAVVAALTISTAPKRQAGTRDAPR